MRFIFIVFAFLLLPQAAFAQGCTAVLVSDNAADYAAASVLAQKMDFELLTTPWGRLSDNSLQGLQEKGCEKVLVVGGNTAVPGAEEALAGSPVTLERIGGRDRYETSASIALQWRTSLIVLIAQGRDTQGISDAQKKADAVGAPLIFVKDGEVPESTGDAIVRLKARDARIIPSPLMDTQSIVAAVKKRGITDTEVKKIDKKERARTAIDGAILAILRAETSSSDKTDAKALAASKLLEAAKKQLDLAHHSFENSDYGRAFGRATSARENAENSQKISIGITAGYLQNLLGGARGEMSIDIGEISLNPVKYHGTIIKVTGEVMSDPVYIGDKTYIELRDATGRIFVEKKGFAGPPVIEKGQTIEVTGAVRINPSYGGPHGGMDQNLPSYIIEATGIENV